MKREVFFEYLAYIRCRRIKRRNKNKAEFVMRTKQAKMLKLFFAKMRKMIRQ
jgi:hypothetical protein